MQDSIDIWEHDLKLTVHDTIKKYKYTHSISLGIHLVCIVTISQTSSILQIIFTFVTIMGSAYLLHWEYHKLQTTITLMLRFIYKVKLLTDGAIKSDQVIYRKNEAWLCMNTTIMWDRVWPYLHSHSLKRNATMFCFRTSIRNYCLVFFASLQHHLKWRTHQYIWYKTRQ